MSHKNTYGHFDNPAREYVVTNPATPTPWINYIGHIRYGGFVSNNAGGFSYHLTPKKGRLLRYRYNGLPEDRPGRYVYIRDNDSGDFWSTAWQPVQKPLEQYHTETRHGLGYTKIISQYSGIKTTTTYFVPMGEDLELWAMEIENGGSEERRLSTFSYAEFCPWDPFMDQFAFTYSRKISRLKATGTGIDYAFLMYYHEAIRTARHSTYFAVNEAICGYETIRERFIGRYRSESNPVMLESGETTDQGAIGGNPVAVLKNAITLKPGQKKFLVYVLGPGTVRKEGRKALARYGSAKGVEAALAKLAAWWDGNLSTLSVRTPDANMNTMLNLWNQYQCHLTFVISRSTSLYDGGFFREGFGYRDSHQDTLGVMHCMTPKVRERLITLLGAQYKNGKAPHIYNPLTDQGRGWDCSDDHLWIVQSACAYVKESGDLSFFREQVKFLDGGKAPVYEHLRRALEHSLATRGRHGLCLCFEADWNDCLNMHEGGVSVWTTIFLAYGLREFADAARTLNKTKDADRYAHAYEQIKAIVNKVAWDGDWYTRAYTAKGHVAGSRKNKEGKLFLLPQAWAVMAGIADKKRATACMDSVARELYTKHGLVKLTPSYTKYDDAIGSLTSFPPGTNENGGVFCHSNPWAVVAECLLGRGNLAFKYYNTLNPARYSDDADVHATEPYVYSQQLRGFEHPNFGMAENSWLTGTAAWAMYSGITYILGLQPQYGGLLIDPCIPAEWDGFEINREFRGHKFRIAVENPDHVQKGVRLLIVDGNEMSGNLIPDTLKGREHDVLVIMG